VIDDAVLYAPIRELAAGLRAGRFSPVELTEAYLARLETIGPELGAVVTVLRDSALAEAARAEAELRAGRDRGLLHGIPWGAKDLLATRGVPTTWGAAPYRDQVFDYDATVVRRLREAGAILVAKLAMIEIAGGLGYDQADASLTGPCRTPWNRDFWSGGSSSGSAAAVAAGLVPFAIGSETWGSIVTPAAFCGVTGLRPSYGRVSRHGAMALSWSMDKIGPIGRTADGCGIVLAAIAGPDPLDPTTLARPFDYAPDRERAGGWRIGVLKDATRGTQPEVAANFEAAVDVLRSFATVVEGVELPDYPYNAIAGTIIDAEAASAFEELIESGRVRELAAPGSRTGGYSGIVILARDYLKALRLRGPLRRDLDALLAGFDAIVSPTRATVAYPIDRPFHLAYPGLGGGAPAIGAAANLAGLPGIAVPNGFGENGLPTSLTLTGRAFSENRLLAIAAAYQRATDWHTRRPPVA